jgi:hypothetical protein
MIKDHLYKKNITHPFYTEGPAWDAAGNFYFTTLTGGSIMRM